jgi:hypothetical protein
MAGNDPLHPCFWGRLSFLGIALSFPQENYAIAIEGHGRPPEVLAYISVNFVLFDTNKSDSVRVPLAGFCET